MIRIFAAELEPEEVIPQRPISPLDKTKERIPNSMPTSENIPLADDESVPSGEAEGPQQFKPEPHPDFPPEEFEEITPQPPVNQPAQPQPEDIPEPKPAKPQPQEEEEPSPFPEDEFEEITEELTELDKMNATLSVPAKIDKAMAEGYPLRIIYTTLKGHTTERTVRPDYFLPARTTGNWVLIAWCELRNDWRGFIVNRVRAAKLEPKND